MYSVVVSILRMKKLRFRESQSNIYNMCLIFQVEQASQSSPWEAEIWLDRGKNREMLKCQIKNFVVLR